MAGNRPLTIRRALPYVVAALVIVAGIVAAFAVKPNRAIGNEPAAPQPPAQRLAQESAGKRLLLLQYPQPEADYLAEHVGELDALPYEGVLFTIPSTDSFRGSVPISVAQFKTELAGMKRAQAALSKVKHNFVYIRLVQTGPLATQTPVVAENFANLAEAARDAGLAGIVYDNEDYEKDTWQPEVACPGVATADCQRQAVQAGKAVMQAAIARWPDITLMTMLGPFFADPPTFRSILYEEPEPRHLILGAYTVGMNEATIGTSATYVDGGEVFSVQNAETAKAQYELRKSVMPRTSSLIPEALKGEWADKLSLAFTFYDERDGTPARWQSDLAVNLAAADRYAWAFSFQHRWIGPDAEGKTRAGKEWIDATVAGRVAAGVKATP